MVQIKGVNAKRLLFIPLIMVGLFIVTSCTAVQRPSIIIISGNIH